MSKKVTQNLQLPPMEMESMLEICGQADGHLKQIEQQLGVSINHRGNDFQIVGAQEAAVSAAEEVLQLLAKEVQEEAMTPDRVHLLIRQVQGKWIQPSEREEEQLLEAIPEVVIKTRNRMIKPRGLHQREYMFAMQRNDLSFGIGPAGTGKSYLAVASAVEALNIDRVKRLILVRPAVEAGEKLGFLPGDLSDKVDPYLRPLYDALYEMLGFEKVAKLIDRNIIEVAPLAFMRGRTLNDSFIILDEAQNTTIEQMKMFLTRIGFGSTAVVTGDVTQVDLPRGTSSGLQHAIAVLDGMKDIHFTFFQAQDVVRHSLVQRIVQAYEAHQKTE